MTFIRKARDLLSPAEWLVVGLSVVALTVVIALAWSALSSRQRAEQATLDGSLATSAGQSAAQAGQILDGAHASAGQSETLSRETADVIRSTPGADQRLDPRLNDAGRKRLCERAAYRGSAECVQLLGRSKPAS